MIINVHGEAEMKTLGVKLGAALRGSEIIELVGDVGAGKTTLTKGIAKGLEIDEDVQSPSFTISRVYDTKSDLRLSHYDFYRLDDAGIMADELHEAINDPKNVTIIEWAEIVNGVLPEDRITIHIVPTAEDVREVTLTSNGEKSKIFLENIA
jgi:tRNA threonylcarbamoyladenosine biosynthesis protein TsaE